MLGGGHKWKTDKGGIKFGVKKLNLMSLTKYMTSGENDNTLLELTLTVEVSHFDTIYK